MSGFEFIFFALYIAASFLLWAVREFPLVFLSQGLLGMAAAVVSKRRLIRGAALVLVSGIGVPVILGLDPWSSLPQYSEVRGLYEALGPLGFFVGGLLSSFFGLVIGHIAGRD